MKRTIVAAITLALAVALPLPAFADTLEIQRGDRIDTYDGVLLTLDQHLKMQRLQFGAIDYTSRIVPWEVSYGTWTIVVNDTFMHDCEILTTSYKAQGPISITARCSP